AELAAVQGAAHDLDGFAHHHGGRSCLRSPFPLAGFLHENLRRPESQQETSRAGRLLQNARFHSDLDGVARVWRNDPPADGNPPRLPRDDGGDRRGRASFHSMLSPPGIGFGEPERIESGAFAGLGHAHGFVQGFHAQLEDTDAERDGHSAITLQVATHSATDIVAASAVADRHLPARVATLGWRPAAPGRLYIRTPQIMESSRTAPCLSPAPRARDGAAWRRPPARPCERWRRS